MTAETARFSFLLTGPELEHIETGSLCYKLPGFPPPPDFPVAVDLNGYPVSYYADPTWRIGSTPFNFGTGPNKLGRKLSEVNAELLKRCLCWFMYGDRMGISVSTLMVYHLALKAVFAFCSGIPIPIAASDLSRVFCHMEEAFAQAIRPSSAKVLGSLLHELWLARETLGFALLEPKQIARLRQLLPEHQVQQTPCIPPRIWAYQAGRLQAFLEDFLAHKSQIKAGFQELLDAYRINFGSLANARDGSRSRNLQRSLVALLEQYGIHDVIARWLFRRGSTWGEHSRPGANILLLSKYLNAVGVVGTAYLQCFSGIRISEALSLRSNCLNVERDLLLGDIYILSGASTKTIQDDNARWLAAPTVALAVSAMAAVARWRTDIALELGFVPLTQEDLENPYLIQRGYEPWTNGGTPGAFDRPTVLRPDGYEITKWASRVPGLFEEEGLRITAEDEAFGRRFNTSLNMANQGDGCLWSLASHQYRRTAAVMMGSSQVSLESQQYQFKHLTRNQSAYYRRGFQSLRLNRIFSNELVETRYELVSVELGMLNGPEYVSPISPTRKDEILKFHEADSGDALQKAIKKGQLAVKQTLFGVCARRDRCPYGGHDNYAHCPDCNDALLNKRKRSSVQGLGKTIAVRLVDAPLGTPLRAQLERSAKAIERFMDVTA